MVSAGGVELSCQELYLIQVFRVSENTAEYSSISLMWRTGLQMHFDSFLTYKVNYCFDYRTGIAICHKLCGMTKLLLASCFPTYNVYYSQNNTMWDRYSHPGTACHVMAFSSSHCTDNAVPFPCASIRLRGT